MSTRRSFALIKRPIHLVSRQDKMEEIYQAIFKPGTDCRLVLVEGEGGMGKSRLVEEVLRRLGNKAMREAYGQPRPENDWQPQAAVHPILLADLIDLTDIHLHTREFFMERLADPLHWDGRFPFSRYTNARDQYQSTARFGAAFTVLEPLGIAAENAFWQDFQEAAAGSRLVIALDTVEQLAVFSSKWLLDRQLITPEETLFNTQEWLLEQIRTEKFINTTFLIVGRKREGKLYFDKLKETAAKTTYNLIPIHLNQFSEEETRRYIKEIHSRLPDQAADLGGAAEFLDWLSQDEERLQVLHLCTGGQPIRLALYLDVMDKSPAIPPPLRQSLAELQATINNLDEKLGEAGKGLGQVQLEIEQAFIKLLFAYHNDLPTQILRMLVRTRRGLTAEQLHFVLDSSPDQRVDEWSPDQTRLEEIEKMLAEIRNLSIVKAKPDGRTGLQDEMYRIYANGMAADPQDRQDEKEARQTLCQKLQAWAAHERKELDERDTEYVREDLRNIRPERPSRILQTRLPSITSWEEKARAETNRKQAETTLEFLHYTLLIDANLHFNDTYYVFANERVSAYQETTLAMVQAEMWRILDDDTTFYFFEAPERPHPRRWVESLETILRRSAQIDDAAKWILRFILQEKYHRAIELADGIEREAAALEYEPDRHAWTHTLSKGERSCWREKAAILASTTILEAAAKLKQTAKQLKKLSEADQKTLVFVEKQEHGFIGHPAEQRLLFVLALTYNHLGYGLTTSGHFHEAVHTYAESLKYFRRLPPNKLKSEEATVRNNLARALVEMGMKRSIRVCRDGLELRIQVGDWLPIAYSLNTMGLIMNDLYRPKESVEYCARAYAIASSIGDDRLIGLSLTQLGESLRRLAQSDPKPEDGKEEIFREAADALGRALILFQKSEEKVRLIETQIEFGCLFRDWLNDEDRIRLPDIWRRHFRSAVDYLSAAIKEAQARQLTRLELDARVNLAWVYFRAGEGENAEQTLADAIALVQIVEPGVLLVKGQLPPNRQEIKYPPHYFKQLSKIYGLYGRLTLDQFTTLTEKQKPPTTQERREILPEVQTTLCEAADYYVQSLGYAELFLPRSEALTTIYNELYNHLKKMNRYELAFFYHAEKEATADYRIEEIKITNFGLMRGFLLDNFGDYYDADDV